MLPRLAFLGVCLLVLHGSAVAQELSEQALIGPRVPVAVAGSESKLVLLDERGNLWVRDGGSSLWVLGLRAPSGETGATDALIELDSLLEAVTDIEASVDEDGEVIEAEADQAALDRIDELLDQIRKGDAGGLTWRPWLKRVTPDRVLANTERGVWVYELGGLAVSYITPQRATDAAWWRGEVVILTQEQQVVTDGRTLEYPGGALALAAADGVLWAGGPDGLHRYDDEGWTRVAPLSVSGLIADPGWEGGLWARDADGALWRSDDGGATLNPLDGAPPASRLDVGLPTAGGQLLVTGAEGTWTHDAEVGWVQLDTRPGVDVTGWDGVHVIAEQRLWGSAEAVEGLGPLDEWIPLGALLTTAINRPELRASVSAQRWGQTLVPDLTVQGEMSPEDSLGFDGFTTAGTGNLWTAKAILTWTPAGRTSGSEDFDAALDDVAIRTGLDLATGRDALNAMAGGAGRAAVDYRSDLSDQIVDLFDQRQALMMHAPATARSGLLDQVAWQLQLHLVEARLDALTDGAVSAWSHNE